MSFVDHIIQSKLDEAREALFARLDEIVSEKLEEAKAIRFEMKKKILDEQIEMKNKMKSILSAEQFAKWEMRKEKNNKPMGEGRKKHKAHQRD